MSQSKGSGTLCCRSPALVAWGPAGSLPAASAPRTPAAPPTAHSRTCMHICALTHVLCCLGGWRTVLEQHHYPPLGAKKGFPRLGVRVLQWDKHGQVEPVGD